MNSTNLKKFVKVFNCLIALFLVLALASCSNKDSLFKNELFRLLNSSRDSEINARQKKLFDKFYGFEKAKQEGVEYCKLLTNGASQEELNRKNSETVMALVSQGKVTPQESADLMAIDVTIKIAAKKAYCADVRF